MKQWKLVLVALLSVLLVCTCMSALADGETTAPIVHDATHATRTIYVKDPSCFMQERTEWYWSETRLSRAVLETLYFRGELMVHHKAGNIKFYTKSSDVLPQALLNAPDPFPDEAAHLAWRITRRIGAVGLLGNRTSDAFLGLDLRGGKRQAAFAAKIPVSAPSAKSDWTITIQEEQHEAAGE